jgi:hypothetical protein
MAQRGAVRDMMNSYSYPTASVQVGRRGAVALARISGVVTPSAAGRIIRDSSGWGGKRTALVNVVDYSGSAVAIGADHLLSVADQAQRFGVQIVPTALVVSAEQLPMFRAYADLSMACGILKAAFLRLDDAQRWAARQAVVAEEWARMRSALRSAP